MERTRAHVKPKRSYDSAGRRRQAERRRAAILDVAQRRFLDDGYAATTIATIASKAGVSVGTIYKSFGGKTGRGVSEVVRSGMRAGQARVEAPGSRAHAKLQ